MTTESPNSVSTGINSSGINASAYSNPLFLSHTDNPGAVIVSQVFNGKRFGAWKRATTLALSVKNKLGFVTGRTKKPAEDDPSYEDWERCNSIVITWILNAVTPEISESLIYHTSAKAIWNELQHMYEQSNLVVVFQLQKELNLMSQGSDSVTTYYTKFKRTWDEFASIDEMPDCNCSAGEAWMKRMDRQQLVQFLFGLNDSYASTRGSILHRKPTPILAEAYAILIQEEQQREITALMKLNIDSAAMYAKNTQNKTLFGNEMRKNMVCNYCKKKGHIKSECYKLNGFPEHFKFTNSRKSTANVTIGEEVNAKDLSGGSSEMTSKDYNQLMNFLKQCKVVDSTSTSGLTSGSGKSDVSENAYAAAVNGFAACAVPRIKKENQLHSDALQLVKSLCKAISSSHGNDTYYRFARPAILEAAKNGIPEVVEEIVDEMPLTIWSKSEDMGIFQFAVVNRCEKVFNLIYQMGDHKQRLLKTLDGSGNNILHLAGQIAPLHKLNLVSGAALQMQRELQWYEEVEKLLTLPERQKPNRCGMTPKMLFSKGHEKLVIDGEKWMINTANSCTIAAALIVTIVFAAAITVPGGLDQETGKPIYSEQSAFKLFFVSNAISLFTATTSLLMFLSILTARYAEEDFRFSLPNRLIIGLVTLFVSTTAMMIAFSSILYIVFGQGNAWSILPTIGLACLPVTSFVALQFPLLVDVISSTYGRGVFGKQSSRRLY